MELNSLTAISPVDGRYRGKCDALAAYFSEYALMRYRVKVEIEYFIALCEIPLPQLAGVDSSVFPSLRAIYSPENFTLECAGRIKEIEQVTNHDVKAVEYFIKEQFDRLGHRIVSGPIGRQTGETAARTCRRSIALRQDEVRNAVLGIQVAGLARSGGSARNVVGHEAHQRDAHEQFLTLGGVFLDIQRLVQVGLDRKSVV